MQQLNLFNLSNVCIKSIRRLTALTRATSTLQIIKEETCSRSF